MFTPSLASTGEKISPLYDWRAPSTYIRRPPLPGKVRWPVKAHAARFAPHWRFARQHHHRPPVAVERDFGDSAAGEYHLKKNGLPEEDYKLRHASRRSPHRSAPPSPTLTLMNEMVRGADGAVKKGFAGTRRAGRQGHAHGEAIETYMDRKQPLIIIAGADYGQAARATGRPRASAWRA